MKIRFILTGAVLAVVALCNCKVSAAEEIQKLTEKQNSQIEEYVERERKGSNIPGVAVAVVHGDEIVYSKGFGVADSKDTPVTADTPFYIGSVGKTFTALAIRQLEGEGKLDSKNLVTEYIPWFTLADGMGKQITIDHLLTHTSGLSTAAGNEAYSFNHQYSIKDAVLAINRRAKTNRLVGEKYEYSNLNYVILGLIVEYVSGMSYEDYIQKYVYAPIGMKDSFASIEKARLDGLAEGFRELYGINVPIECPYPTGQVPAGYQLCSVNDMAKYVVYYLNNGYAGGESILPNNKLDPIADPFQSFQGKEDYYSLDWGITNDPAIYDYNRFYGFLGATPNFNSAMLLSQVHRYGIVVLVNQRGSYRKPELMSQVIGNGISDILLHDTLPAPMQRSYDRKVFLTPLLVLIITALCIHSCIRHARRSINTKQGIIIVSMVTIHFIIPAAVLIGIPRFYSSNWKYFLSVGIDTGLPVLLLCVVLLVTGVVKTILLLNNVSCTRNK